MSWLPFLVDGLLLGSTLALGAVGLTLTYSILGFANFTHGDLITWGAYFVLSLLLAWTAASGTGLGQLGALSFGWPFLGALAVAMLLTGVARAPPRARPLPAPSPARHPDRARHRELRRLAGAALRARVRPRPRARLLHPRDPDRGALPARGARGARHAGPALRPGAHGRAGGRAPSAPHPDAPRARDAGGEREPRARPRRRRGSSGDRALDVDDRRGARHRGRGVRGADRPGPAVARLRPAPAALRGHDPGRASGASTAPSSAGSSSGWPRRSPSPWSARNTARRWPSACC